MTLSQALIGETIPPRERARYQGFLAAVAVCANTFGPIAGGVITEHLGWRWIFLINLPIGFLALALTKRLPISTAARVEWRADPGGLILFAVFVTTTLLSLEQIQRVDLAAAPLAGGLLATGLLALVLLIRQEKRTPSPLIPLALLRQPAIWRADAMAACHGAALVSLITFLPVYLQVVRGISPSTIGLVPLTVGIGTGSLITGRLVSKTGMTTVFPAVGLVLLTINFVVLAVWASDVGLWVLSGLLLWNGLFMGTVMGVVQVTVQSAAGQLRLGEAAASVQFSRSIGAAMGTALVATVLFAILALKSPEAMKVFVAMVEHGRQFAPTLAPERLAAVQDDIRTAFRAVFLTIALFTSGGFLLAVTNPLRRI
jgi:MFS family permease